MDGTQRSISVGMNPGGVDHDFDLLLTMAKAFVSYLSQDVLGNFFFPPKETKEMQFTKSEKIFHLEE